MRVWYSYLDSGVNYSNIGSLWDSRFIFIYVQFLHPFNYDNHLTKVPECFIGFPFFT